MKIESRFENIKKMNKEQFASWLFKFSCSCHGGLQEIQEKEKFNCDDFLNYLNGNVICE